MKTLRHARATGAALMLCLCLALPAGVHVDAARAEISESSALLDKIAKAFTAVSKKALPAVVHIRVEKSVKDSGNWGMPDLFNDPFFERFFGPGFRHPGIKPKERRQRGAGSGFIISHDGYILTNNHVVEDASVIKVILSDKRQFDATVVGTDPQTDVALIKIDADGDLPVLPLGDSDKIEVGESVIAIGNPFELSQSVTVGVVSAKGRSRMGINDYENFIQTDAAINPGNSGGPLINIHGEAIGINTAIFSRSGGYMGIGFAIPINMAKQIKDQLLKNGKVVRGWLGVVIQDLDEDLAKSFDLDKPRGALVGEVRKGSPADRAGIEEGDIILSVDGRKVADVATLRNRVAMIPPGTKVEIKVLRDGREKSLRVKIGEQPATLAMGGREGGLLASFGLTLQELDKELADQFGYDKGDGLLISDVEPGSVAAEAGLRPGNLIEEVNRHRVGSLKDLRKALKDTPAPGKVLLRVRSGGYRHYVVLRAR